VIQTACAGLWAQMLPLLFALACKPDPAPSDDSQPEVVKPQDSDGGDSYGGDSDPPHSEDTGLPCGDVDTDPLRIDACWQLVAAPELHDQASLFATGALLMGCEDELPPLTLVNEEGEAPAIVLAVDPAVAPDAYTVRVEPRRVRITGADRAGLAWGMIDWLRSLDRIDLSSGVSWRPDPTSTLTEGPTVCSDYDAACDETESCQLDGAWTAVEQVWWTAQDVNNRPAVDLRVVFPSFKGSQNATFLPTLWQSELGACADPLDTAPFWESVLHCDAHAAPDEDGYDRCDEVRLRLDTLLIGRFTHALDDGYAFQMGDSVQTLTGCSPTQLYADVKDYLSQRGVALIPTVYGQETRAPETPIAGDYVFKDEPAELWGSTGDATLSEGLAMGGTFTVCDHDGERLLAMDCDTLDADGRVSAPDLLSPTYDTDTTAVGVSIGKCAEHQLCQVKTGCWDTVTDTTGLALTPADASLCTSPALRVPLDDDGQHYVLRFRGSVINSGDLTAKLIVVFSDGRSYASSFEVLSTLASEADYLSPTPALDPSRGDWVLFSFVFRTPNPDALISSVYAQINGEPGSLAMVDDLDLAAIDGQLRELDAQSLSGVSCASVSDPAVSPLPVEAWYSADGAVSGAKARLSVDCLEVGETVELRYRSFTHYGLWPGHSSRQSAYNYTVDVSNPQYWSSPTGPWAQIQTTRDGGELGDFVLISDLGGEARGVGRAESLTGLGPAEVLASFTCAVEAEVCEGCGDCDELLSASGGPVAPCTCEDWSGGPQLLVAGDMFTWLHNGGDSEAGQPGKEDYQLPYGGPSGGSWWARRWMPPNTLYLSWFHFDSQKDGVPVGGHEQVTAFVEDFAADGLRTIPVSAWDPDAQRAWAALAAAGGPVAGVAHYGWGTDTQAARVARQAGAVFWSPGWRQLAAWTQSDDATLPGGDERGELTLTGLTFETATGLDWPLVSRWLRILDDSASWEGPAVAVTGDRVLARVYATPPEGCEWTGRFTFGDVVVDVPETPTVTGEYRVWGFTADRPEGAAEVRFSFHTQGCAGGVIDHIALYDALPTVDFPYPLSLEHLDDWDADSTADARYRICGDALVWECVNADSWE